MHPLLVLFYCCAVETPTPTPVTTWTLFATVGHILGLGYLAYASDPCVMVSLFHAEMEPSTLCLEEITAPDRDVTSKVWGPAAWTLLHELATSPHSTRVPELLACWTHMLPCAVCRTHLAEHLAGHSNLPVDMYRYTVALHNAVNVSLGKPVVHEVSSVGHAISE